MAGEETESKGVEWGRGGGGPCGRRLGLGRQGWDDGGVGVALRFRPTKGEMRWGGGTGQGERRRHGSGVGAQQRGPKRERQSPWEEGHGGWEGGVDTSAASGSPWPAGGWSWRGNPAAPPGSASGPGTTVGPLRGAGRCRPQGCGHPPYRERAAEPLAWAELPASTPLGLP